jgi:hypothetical protein
MASNYMKKASPSLAKKEMQINTYVRFHLTTIRLTFHQENKQQMLVRIQGEKGTLIQFCWEYELV